MMDHAVEALSRRGLRCSWAIVAVMGVVTALLVGLGLLLGWLPRICAINAFLTTIFLVIIRVPFFLPLAILSGTSSLVPYVGPLVVGAAITLFALITDGVWTALAAAIYFVVYGQLIIRMRGARSAHEPPR